MTNFRPHLPRALTGTVALAAFMALGGGATASRAEGLSGNAAGTPAVQTANGIRYVNGGIGQLSQRAMRREAQNWPLRMTFSESRSYDYVADVRLEVADDSGGVIFTLEKAGPITYVSLKPGAYRIVANHDGQEQTRKVNVGLSTEVNFHWKR